MVFLLLCVCVCLWLVAMPARRDDGGSSCRDLLGGGAIHVRAHNNHDDGQDLTKDDRFKEENPFNDNTQTNRNRAQNQPKNDPTFLNAHRDKDALEGLHKHDDDCHPIPPFHKASLLDGIVEEEQDVQVGHPGAEEGEDSLLFPEDGGGC